MDTPAIKSQFPIFEREPDLVYLDSAATALKPESVLEAMDLYYREYSSNVSRGLYPMAEMATVAVEQAREKIAVFIGVKTTGTVFVSNATSGINLVTNGLRERVTPKHNIVVTALEHHSNFLPWKELARVSGAELRIAPVEASGKLSPEAIAALVDEHTFAVAFASVSNVLGLINPVAEIARAVRKKNKEMFILIDACQAVGHIPVSLSEWDVDFLVFSGHKVFGPTGIGVLAGKPKSLALLGAVHVGGGTIKDPLSTPAEYKDTPERFEAGTPNIAGIIGLGAAIEFIEGIGLDHIREHETALIDFTLKKLQEAFGEKIHVLGSIDPEERAGIISFSLSDIHPHDMAHMLGEKGICIRAGEHCARPLHRSLDLSASARISLSVYNTEEDIKKLIAELIKIQSFLFK